MNKRFKAIIRGVDRTCNTRLMRKRYAKSELKRKTKVFGEFSIDRKYKSEILHYWKELGVIPNMDYILLYNRVNEMDGFDPRYLSDDLFYCFVDPYFNKADATTYLDDKNLYDFYFSDIPRPMTIGRKINGHLLNASFGEESKEKLLELCESAGEVIVKRSVDSEGGKGVFFVEAKNNMHALEKLVDEESDFVVQEIIKQHPLLNAIHVGSINTIRIMSLEYSGEIIALSTVLRMGRNGSRVDNASSGGLFCGIDDKGRLKKFAFDMDGNKYDRHPDGVVFEGYYIPGIDECKRIIEKKAILFSRFSRLISWDFAIDEKGYPILIEVNLAYGQLDFHQMTNGPIFKDLTPSVIKEVFINPMKKTLYRICKL